jgi:hypothetical protein
MIVIKGILLIEGEGKMKEWKFTAARRASLKKAQRLHPIFVKLGKEVYYRKHK